MLNGSGSLARINDPLLSGVSLPNKGLFVFGPRTVVSPFRPLPTFGSAAHAVRSVQPGLVPATPQERRPPLVLRGVNSSSAREHLLWADIVEVRNRFRSDPSSVVGCDRRLRRRKERRSGTLIGSCQRTPPTIQPGCHPPFVAPFNSSNPIPFRGDRVRRIEGGDETERPEAKQSNAASPNCCQSGLVYSISVSHRVTWPFWPWATCSVSSGRQSAWHESVP